MRELGVVEHDDFAHPIFRQLGGRGVEVLTGDYRDAFAAAAFFRQLDSGVDRDQRRLGEMSRHVFGKDQYVSHLEFTPARPSIRRTRI